MENNKHIDNLFSEKLNNRQFDFDPENWKAAEKLMDQERKRPKAAWLWSGIAGAAAVLVASLLLYNWNSPKNDVAAEFTERSSRAATIQPDNAALVKDENQLSSNETGSLNKTAGSDNKAATDSRTKTERPAVENSNQGNRSINTEQEPPNPKTPSPEERTSRKAVKAKILEDSMTQPAGNGNQKGRSLPVSMETENESRENGTGTILSVANLPSEKMTALPPSIAVTQHQAVVARVISEKPESNFLRRSQFALLGGANIFRGFINTGTGREDPSVTPVFGLHYTFFVDNTVAIGSDISYSYRGSLNSRLTSVTTEKDVTITEEVNSRHLHYLNIPFYLEYHFERNSLKTGLQYSHLLTAFHDIATTTESGSGNNIEKRKQWGKADNFATSDLAILIGYERMLSEKINIGISLSYGLFDITDDHAFRSLKRDKNLNNRIYLKYMLF